MTTTPPEGVNRDAETSSAGAGRPDAPPSGPSATVLGPPARALDSIATAPPSIAAALQSNAAAASSIAAADESVAIADNIVAAAHLPSAPAIQLVGSPSRLVFALTLASLTCVGCFLLPPFPRKPVVSTAGANRIGIFSLDYLGNFGDATGEDTKRWGCDDTYRGVTVIAHFPTRSEFMIYSQSFKRREEIAATNTLRQMVDRSLPRIVPPGTEEKHETWMQAVAGKHREKETRPFNYLKLEFDGKRYAPHRHSTNEVVSSVLYATDLPCVRTKERRLFGVLAMIPKETSADQRKHLMDALARFMRELIILNEINEINEIPS